MIVVGQTTTTNVHGNHKQRNQQANLPLFNIEMMTTQMTCERKKGNGITTGLPPDESFTFIVCEQDCLHASED
jgi:hypothetical protein